ncbi:MAG: SH3 domain-containing protein [Dehalococcoidia bacterium]|nr:SH3 domain-containing protein [Dehalococcoidia bacterium]
MLRQDSPTVTPVPELTSTPTPRPTLIPTPGETDGGVIAIINADADEGLNARTEPSTDSAVLETIPHETEVELTGGSQVIDDIEWVELVRGGWVQSQYLVYP